MSSSKVIIETKRLILRSFIIEDATFFYNLNKDKEVLKYTGDKPFTSVSEAQKFIKNYSEYKNYGYGRWVVCKKETNTPIGFCGLKYHSIEKITEIGFRFFKHTWNKGYATESAKACIAYGFSKLNLNSIYAHTYKENIASQSVLKKCGLQFVKDILYDGIPAKLFCINKNEIVKE